MRNSRRLLILATVIGHLGWQVGAAGEDVAARRSSHPLCRDIRLADSQRLVVQVADAAGRPRPDAHVALWHGERQLAHGVTDHAGRVELPARRGGIYQVLAADQVVVVRAWTAGAAPPAANDFLLIQPAPENPVARGQDPLRLLFGREPLLLGVLAAAAIAIPVAIHESTSDDAPPGS